MKNVNVSCKWKDTPTSRIIYIIQVILQFLAAVIAIGLNTADIATAPSNYGGSSFAIAIATLSTITAITFAIDIFHPFPSRLWLLFVLFWQWVLTFSWLGVVAAFDYYNHNSRVRAAAGINAANLLLWLLGSVLGTILMCFRRKLGRKQRDESHELSQHPPAFTESSVAR